MNPAWPNVGATVRLRSGGPLMTVRGKVGIGEDSALQVWRCEWIHGGEVRHWDFMAGQLVAADGDDEEE